VASRDGLPSRVGHYRIVGKLGEGGMGVVFSARDERLGRVVALKTIRSLAPDEDARRRFWREARAAASVNHPNICQLYEIGEDRGDLFIAMELLEGESLAERLRRGALNLSETLTIALEVLAALKALHDRDIVHRDLKPSNVFLTPHGVKLLDFGLARSGDSGPTRSLSETADLTRTGVVLGTPRYMAPEQVTGEGFGKTSDLFAVGSILFEMLAGRPAFGGTNAVEVLHATLHEQPPALTGSPAVAAVDRVIRRALEKRPEERTPSAERMAEELRAVREMDDSGGAQVKARALTRLVVLPFRILRPDPETDFLAFSLADAIATSLTRFGSLVVRSSAVAARFAKEAPDLKALAAEADVDRVVMGTLLRSGDQLRAVCQLVETPGGALLTSHTVQSSLGDLFGLQDDIARGVVEALALPLGARGDVSTPDAPHDARAYALYLQANELARSYDQLKNALALYEKCLELDPRFAPAWAQVGRCRWLIGKYVQTSPDSGARAEEALRRALELDPHLSTAHKLMAHLESETGEPRRALERLLGEARRRGNDAELFAGLVHACRYCGLFEESIAAHEEARRLDPNVPTSVAQTLLMTGDLERVLAVKRPPGARTGDDVIQVIGLGLAGRRDEARRTLAPLAETAPLEIFRAYANFLFAWLDRRPTDMVQSRTVLRPLKILDDPEAIFQEGWLLCDAGESAGGLVEIRRALDRGYAVFPTLAASHAFDALRGDPAFEKVLADARAGHERARTAFLESGGATLLGR
jgi:TolB-like protein